MTPRLMLRLDFGPESRIGPGKIRLLELVRETGSISAAGRAMEMSYRRAWLLIDSLNATFDQPVVKTKLGGKGGGSASLTGFGEELVSRYRAMEKKAGKAIAADLAALDAAHLVKGG